MYPKNWIGRVNKIAVLREEHCGGEESGAGTPAED
jgi:hypothetical protein